jgi:deoxyribonuclease V
VPDSELDYDGNLFFTYRGEAFTGVAYEDVPGKWLSEVSYRDGAQDGVAREPSPSGKLRVESWYRENTLHGFSREYNENQVKVSEEIYEYGILVRRTKLDGPVRETDSWTIGPEATTEPPLDARPLLVAVDVHYLDDAGARAAAVATRDRTFSTVAWTQIAMVSDVAPYEPGEFYRRELPPLRAVIPASGELALIVVDGYVDLDPDGHPGLGAHVHAEFGVPVIGVAKTAFRTATHAAQVLRGQSSRPLYVTAAGMTVADAAALVAEMAGQFRVPDALKLVDRLARGLERPDLGSTHTL